jgi:iron(III) transport system substrate-binding protein
MRVEPNARSMMGTRLRIGVAAGAVLALALTACSSSKNSAGGSGGGGGGTASGDAPKGAAQIAVYKGADRQSVLQSCAKKEGQVSIIAGEFSDTVISPLAKAFNKKYPYIKVNAIRMDEPAMVTRISQEARAGKRTVDVLDNGPESFTTLQKANLLQPYYTPYVSAYTKDEIGPDSYYVGVRESVMAPVYNTKLIKPADVPHSWNDLLNPALKGKMAVANSDVLGQWITTMIETQGESAAESYFAKLKKQDIKVYNVSVRALVDLVGGGQVPLAITAEAIHAEAAKAKGAPVDWARMQQLVGWTNAMARVKNAPHPCSAALWTDFMLNPSGQSGLATVGYLPAAHATKSQYTAITSANIHYTDQLWMSANEQKLQDLENKYFLK